MERLKGLMITGFAMGVLMLGSGPEAFACKSAGPNKHVGMVKAIDAEGQTFSIIDAETGKEMVFDAPPQIMDRVKVSQRVMVTYRTEGDRLKAQEIES